MSPDEVKIIADTYEIVKNISENKSNGLLPVYSAIGGAIAGAIFTSIPIFILERSKQKKLSKSIKASLLAEIAALLEIIKCREYVKKLDEVINTLNDKPKGAQHKIAVEVPNHYSRVYQNNCSSIGVLEECLARDIVIFHNLIDAVVQDIKVGGMMSKGFDIEGFIQTKSILKEAVILGNEIIKSSKV